MTSPKPAFPVGFGNVAIAMSASPASSGAEQECGLARGLAKIAVEQKHDVGVLDSLRARLKRAALAA